ncbi:MAG: hypothetical protein IPP27_05680 [Bacteroidetes bacterium]|jgi:hypothetical protein|nr:hypothetical protein [Bacteroidota bacterium]MBK8365705.1 hypothetical protein [Bacteroidota bacterium]MBK9412401.1 hypothetical protein [Bacteroidota bacterium]MBL0031685.1 hypothetical protein [Bacteroidota bacterium]MBP6428717.1 hypothetical protein [Bacteroidia bacterium]
MDQDTLDKIASGEYSISPRSGRLRKRVKVKKKKPFFQRSETKKKLTTLVWILLLLGFIISVVLVLPEINIEGGKKKENLEKAIGR